MRIYYKGVFEIDEHLLILAKIRIEDEKNEGQWLVDRWERTGVPRVTRVTPQAPTPRIRGEA